jgi:hypothetical protein
MKSAQLNLAHISQKKIWTILKSLLKTIFFIVLIMEFKHNYQIDIFKSIDFPLDNFYYAIKEKIGLP